MQWGRVIVFATALVCSNAEATSFLEGCVNLCRCLLTKALPRKGKSSSELWDWGSQYQRTIQTGIGNKKFAAAIRGLRTEALERLKRREDQTNVHLPGQIFDVSGLKFQVIDVIGSGSEADLYLVRAVGPLGPEHRAAGIRRETENIMTAKVYRSDKKASAIEEFSQFNKIYRTGSSLVATPHLLDETNGVVLFRYIEGFTVEEISQIGESLGFTHEEIARIQLNYLSLKTRLHEEFRENHDIKPFDLLESNVVYDVDDGSLRIIDRK